METILGTGRNDQAPDIWTKMRGGLNQVGRIAGQEGANIFRIPSAPGSNMWQFRGQQRPSFAIEPKAGQESVWDYPRPPACVPDFRKVMVRVGDQVLAQSTSAMRILETASPPTFYLPPDDVNQTWLQAAAGHSFCEWKGRAQYWTVQTDNEPAIAQAGWSYPEASDAFKAIQGWFSFYPAKVDCFVDGEKVRPQPGGFYGGWITSEIVGPVKGEIGTGGW